VRGLDVHQVVTEPAGPAVSHGRFAVRNTGSDPRWIAVTAVTVTGEASTVAVERFYLYRLPTYDEVVADAVEIESGADTSFEVSFAAVPLATGLATDVAVSCDVTADGTTVRVISPWSGTIRTPRR
jgi:hypothetical protein